jgi:RNA polymerase sigma-70 factor (ECF subfamily)
MTTTLRAVPAPGPRATPQTPESDELELVLVQRIRTGDTRAWSELIERYQDRLFSICVRMLHDRETAADVTQDAFVKIIQGIDSFDGRSKLSTWMIRVTMNVCLSKLRSEKIRRHASLDAPHGASYDGGGSWGDSLRGREPAGTESVEAREERERVLAALRLIEPDQRAVLILADCRGLAYEQIAQVMGVAVGTIKSRVFRARTALRDAVEQMARERTIDRTPDRSQPATEPRRT